MKIDVDGKSVLVHQHNGGGGVAPVWVLIHGAGMDHRVWADVQPALAASDAQVISLDLPGHGGSDGAAYTSVADTADWLDRVLDTLGIKSAYLAGHSYGGLIALDCAARYPARAEGVALLGVADVMPVNADLLQAAVDTPDQAARMIAGWCHGVSKRDDPDGAAQWSERIYRIIEGGGAVNLAPDLSACNAYTDALARAASVACPVRLVLGERDKMTAVDKGLALAGAFPQATATVLSCGHMMMLEQAEETARTLLEAA